MIQAWNRLAIEEGKVNCPTETENVQMRGQGGISNGLDGNDALMMIEGCSSYREAGRVGIEPQLQYRIVPHPRHYLMRA
jgi:hypothetical protein